MVLRCNYSRKSDIHSLILRNFQYSVSFNLFALISRQWSESLYYCSFDLLTIFKCLSKIRIARSTSMSTISTIKITSNTSIPSIFTNYSVFVYHMLFFIFLYIRCQSFVFRFLLLDCLLELFFFLINVIKHQFFKLYVVFSCFFVCLQHYRFDTPLRYFV